jgi:hypothetical protein
MKGNSMKINSPLAIWSLVLGVLSIVLCCGPLTGIPAIICGHMARARIKMDPDNLSGEGMALAGLITGYFGIIAFILMVIIVIVLASLMIPLLIKLLQNLQNEAATVGIIFLNNILPSIA